MGFSIGFLEGWFRHFAAGARHVTRFKTNLDAFEQEFVK